MPIYMPVDSTSSVRFLYPVICPVYGGPGRMATLTRATIRYRMRPMRSEELWLITGGVVHGRSVLGDHLSVIRSAYRRGSRRRRSSPPNRVTEVCNIEFHGLCAARQSILCIIRDCQLRTAVRTCIFSASFGNSPRITSAANPDRKPVLSSARARSTPISR